MNKKVMIVDDELETRETVVRHLNQRGLEAVEIWDGVNLTT